jgi:hypothetical protein
MICRQIPSRIRRRKSAPVVSAEENVNVHRATIKQLMHQIRLADFMRLG